MSKRHRFNLEISDQTYQQLLILRRRLDAASLTEVLRRAVQEMYAADMRAAKVFVAELEKRP